MLEICSSMLKLFIKWKPDWLYEAMPCVYSVAGIVTIYSFGSSVGHGAGALLLTAALMIWMKRREHRSFKHTAE